MKPWLIVTQWSWFTYFKVVINGRMVSNTCIRTCIHKACSGRAQKRESEAWVANQLVPNSTRTHDQFISKSSCTQNQLIPCHVIPKALNLTLRYQLTWVWDGRVWIDMCMTDQHLSHAVAAWQRNSTCWRQVHVNRWVLKPNLKRYFILMWCFDAVVWAAGRAYGWLSGGCWHGYLSWRGADLHMAQLMPLPLTVSCSSISRLVLPFCYWLIQVVPDKGPLNGCLAFLGCHRPLNGLFML